MRDFIAYVQSLSVPIMPFGEAVKIKGNAVAIGEFTETDSTFIGINGVSKIGSSFNITTTKRGPMDAPISDYKKNTKNVMVLDSIGDTYLKTGGVYEVFRGVDDVYAYATFTPYNSNKVFMRKWNYLTLTWKPFEDIAASGGSSTYTTGFWTPKLEGVTTAGAHTYSAQSGSYTKFANMVALRFTLRIEPAGFDALMAGNLNITGIPAGLEPAAHEANNSYGKIEYNILNLGTNFTEVIGRSSFNYIRLVKQGNGVSTNYVKASDIPAGQPVILKGQITYQVN